MPFRLLGEGRSQRCGGGLPCRSGPQEFGGEPRLARWFASNRGGELFLAPSTSPAGRRFASANRWRRRSRRTSRRRAQGAEMEVGRLRAFHRLVEPVLSAVYPRLRGAESRKIIITPYKEVVKWLCESTKTFPRSILAVSW